MTAAPSLPPARALQGSRVRLVETNGLTISENIFFPRTRLPVHAHDQAFFSFTLAGQFQETFARSDYLYGVRSVVFHRASEEHEVEIGHQIVRCLNVDLSNFWIDRVSEISNTAPAFMQEEGGEMAWLAARLYEEICTGGDAVVLAAEGLVLEMLGSLIREHDRRTDRLEPRWLKQVEQILRAESDQRLTVLSLSDRVGVHPVHLSRVWRRFRDCSIQQQVNRIRVDKACARISAGEESFAALAVELGFADQTHFSRVFKQITGSTPGSFRASFGRSRRRRSR